MNKIDIMCQRINDKLGLHNRQIGSIERYTDSATNSVVQIANKNGAHITLVTGTDEELISYLNNNFNKK